MKYNILIVMSLLFIFKLEAQNNTNGKNTGFHLEGTIPTQKNKKIYLASYWKGNTYAKDSALVSDKGKVVFSLPERLPTGQYLLFIRPNFQADFLLDENHVQNDIRFFIDEKDFSKSTASGSSDTKLLWEYLSGLQSFNKERNVLIEQAKDSVILRQQGKEIREKLKDVDEKSYQFTSTFADLHKNEWIGAFLKGTLSVLPDSLNNNETASLALKKEYLKRHFFDNVNLKDARLWYTNYLNSYIDSYMSEWVDQYPDSLAAAASWLVGQTKDCDLCFKEMLSKLSNESMRSLKMGDENIWARLAEDYILEKNLTWIDSTQTSEIKSMYELIKNNRIGMKGHNLILENLDGENIDTDNIDAEYLILYFYDPTCGHCITDVPKINEEIYKKYKDNGVKVVAVNVRADNKDEWKKFVEDKGISEWINVADPNYKSLYWLYYDTSGVPMVYILDKNKTIIAKKVGVDGLKQLFGYYIK